jgi:phosphoserine phosphatase
MKYAVQKSWYQVIERIGSEKAELMVKTFVLHLDKHVRSGMKDIINSVKCHDIPVLLTTAAPAEYAKPFGLHLGIDNVVATEFRYTEWHENRQQDKLRATLKRMDEMGVADRSIILFTDHEDDAVLTRKATHVVWCGPVSAGPLFNELRAKKKLTEYSHLLATQEEFIRKLQEL